MNPLLQRKLKSQNTRTTAPHTYPSHIGIITWTEAWKEKKRKEEEEKASCHAASFAGCKRILFFFVFFCRFGSVGVWG